MLKAQRRHRPPCTKPMWDAGYTKCSCPIVIRGTINRKAITVSTAKYLPAERARNMEAARDLALLWERAGKLVHPAESLPPTIEPDPNPSKRNTALNAFSESTIESAVEAFMAAAAGNGLAKSTMEKKRTVFTTGPESLLRFSAEKGLRFLRELTANVIRDQWRPTWKLAPLSRFKRQKSVLGFFWFCERSGWFAPNYTYNLTLAMGRIKVQKTQTGYFPPDEYAKILDATYLYSDRPSVDNNRAIPGEGGRLGGERIRAVTELMRWTGLRIRDAVTLERRRVGRDPATGMWSVILYQKKTGDDVYCPLPPDVAELLINVPASQKGNTNPTYFFWTGNGSPKTLVANWQRSYGKLFALAKITQPDGVSKRCFPHMFRDTFAVESLLSGMKIEDVSSMLGHSSIRTTQESYMPWVRARQNSLNSAVRDSWVAQGKVATGPPRPDPLPARSAGVVKVVPISRAG